MDFAWDTSMRDGLLVKADVAARGYFLELALPATCALLPFALV
jgi:hypothetical protein